MVENKAEAKIEGFRVLKAQIFEDIEAAHEKLEDAKNKIKDSIKNAQNPEGLLTRQESSYTRCLELKK